MKKSEYEQVWFLFSIKNRWILNRQIHGQFFNFLETEAVEVTGILIWSHFQILIFHLFSFSKLFIFSCKEPFSGTKIIYISLQARVLYLSFTKILFSNPDQNIKQKEKKKKLKKKEKLKKPPNDKWWIRSPSKRERLFSPSLKVTLKRRVDLDR